MEEVQDVKMTRWLDNLWHDMGKLLPYMSDETVTDIFCLESGEIIVSRLGKPREYTGKFLTEREVERIIYSCASILEKKLAINRALVKLEGVLPKFNARITAVRGDCVRRAVLTLRLPCRKSFSLEDYLEKGRLEKGGYEKILKAIDARKNILISGSTGSGKTTLFNAILKKMVEMTPDDNFYIVEDVGELLCEAKTKVRATPRNLHFAVFQHLFGIFWFYLCAF